MYFKSSIATGSWHLCNPVHFELFCYRNSSHILLCVGNVPICGRDWFRFIVQLTHGTSGNLVHFDFLLLQELNLDIHLRCNCAHIHSSNWFIFIVATAHGTSCNCIICFFIRSQHTHSFALQLCSYKHSSNWFLSIFYECTTCFEPLT
jgi:hypothetical protein